MDSTVAVALLGLLGVVVSSLGTQRLANQRENTREQREDARTTEARNHERVERTVRLLDRAGIALLETAFVLDSVGLHITFIQEGRIDYTVEGEESPLTAQEAAFHEVRKAQEVVAVLWRLTRRLALRLPPDHDALAALEDAGSAYHSALGTVAEWSAKRVDGQQVTDALDRCQRETADAEERFKAACRTIMAPALSG